MSLRCFLALFGLVGTFWGQIDTRISPAPAPPEQTASDATSKWTGARLSGFLAEELGSTLEQGMETTFAFAESETNQLPTYNHYGLSRIAGTLSLHRDWSRASLLMQYAGGADIYSNSNAHYHQLSATQAFKWLRWNFSMNQGFSYLPDSSYGFYPTHGIGDGLVASANNGVPEGPALFLPVNVSERMASTQGSAEYVIGVHSSLTFTGSFSDMHFSGVNPGTPLVDSQMLGSGAEYTYALNASSSMGAGYQFLQGRSLGINSVLQAHSVTGVFSRTVGKRWLIRVSAGPQFATLNEFGTETTLGTSVTVAANLDYQLGRTKLRLSDFRGTNPGSGLFLGSRVNDIQASMDRQFGPTVRGSISAGHARNDNLGSTRLNAPQHYSAAYIAATVERDFGRTLSGFLTYSIQDQSSDFTCNTSGCPIFNVLQMGTIGLRFHIHPLTLQP